MARRTRKRALQENMDSEEEYTFSSEEDEDFEDERLHFEERFDPVEDTNEWVFYVPTYSICVSAMRFFYRQLFYTASFSMV